MRGLRLDAGLRRTNIEPQTGKLKGQHSAAKAASLRVERSHGRHLQRVQPQRRFSTVTVSGQPCLNGRHGRLDHLMFRVGGQLGSNGARESPARPGAPATLFATGFIHPVGIMLKVNPGIADGELWRRERDQPRHRSIREGKLAEHRFFSGQIGAECPIKTEQCPRRETLLPEGVTVLETGVIKLGAAIAFAKGVQRPPVKAAPRNRQVWARRKRRGHSRVGAPENAARQPRVG